MNIPQTREWLHHLDFRSILIEALGWSRPVQGRPVAFNADGARFERRPIAELGGVTVFEVTAAQGEIPDRQTRAAVHREVSQICYENLLIFLDRERTQSLWYWVKREGGKGRPREHLYIRGQPGDLFLSKISAMFVDIGELDEHGSLSVTEAARRLRQALDVEPVTKRFFNDFAAQHGRFLVHIRGIEDERDRRWYASALLNRLMFVYFLQRKGFLDNGDFDYLQTRLAQSKQRGPDRYYEEFLHALFFEGLARPEDRRSPAARALLGRIRYLNGGLFLPHPIEIKYRHIHIPDAAFDELFDLFGRYSWNLDDTPGGADNEINPAVLGYIFEKYINQKLFGAYYTRAEITEYLCERTIHRLILEQINHTPALPGTKPRHFDTLPDLLMALDAPLCLQLLTDVLPKLSLLDPACGSGAFLVAAMKTLIDIYSAVVGRIEFLNDHPLNEWLRQARAGHPNLAYYIKKRIITDNLFGVDVMEEAVEIARLRLFLALVSSARTADDLEPLPNIDFNILAGNSLVGLLRVDEAAYDRGGQGSLFHKPYRQVVEEKNRLLRIYRDATTYATDLQALRDDIQAHRAEAYDHLNELLLDEFTRLGVRYEQATWDAHKGAEGKPQKRAVQMPDIAALHPFHWGYEFDEVMNERGGFGEPGGFDAIITNPPWEIWKPQAKEFLAEYSDLVTKKKMTIKEFEREQQRLLADPEVRAAWLGYQNRFPHLSAYFRAAPQYANQVAIVNGRKAGTDINLYKLFLEQGYNLLRPGGLCGIVIPSGIYTDLGAKQLRQMLFEQTQVSGLFCFENRREIFEGVHRSFKFVVLTFEKGSTTASFPAAFMRHDVAELERFPQEGAVTMPVELIRRLSPDSLSVMEFKSELDAAIAEKMLRWPLLGEEIEEVWNLRLTREFDMTNDSHLFKTSPGPGRLPLYEGKMIHQFRCDFAEPRYWVDEREGRAAIMGRGQDTGQTLDYQTYRLGFRDIAASTNERSMISTLIPPAFHGNKIPTVRVFDDQGNHQIDSASQIFLCAVWNSFVFDWMLRTKVTTTINFFYLYQMPVPRLTAAMSDFRTCSEPPSQTSLGIPDSELLDSDLRTCSELPSQTSLGIPDPDLLDSELRTCSEPPSQTSLGIPDPDLLDSELRTCSEPPSQTSLGIPDPDLLDSELRTCSEPPSQTSLGIPDPDLLDSELRTCSEPPSQTSLGIPDSELLDSDFRTCSELPSQTSLGFPNSLGDAQARFFAPIVARAARLVCTAPEFDALAREVGLPGSAPVAEAERARLRAELDGLVAHLYGLSESEFVHILEAFPLVAQEVKQAALAAYAATPSLISNNGS